MRPIRTQWGVAVLVGVGGIGWGSSAVVAQGCEPIRFTTPVDLGGLGKTYLPRHEWRATLAYRRLHSNEWYIGTEQQPTLAPGGTPPTFDIHTVIGDLGYSLTDRIRLHLSVPFSTGSISRLGWADGLRHQQKASGVGDINLTGELWLLNPKRHEGGNISVGLGVKAPTGSHNKESQFFTATGPIAFPADQTIQPSDGGWGFTLQAQVFQRVTEGLFAYGFGSYMASPKAQTEVTVNPTSTVHWSVPDVYSARAGAAYNLLPDRGLTVSLGARQDGIPRNDLFGGGDSTTIKRTSKIIYLDPGLSLNLGRSTFTLSVPIRMHVNRIKSGLEARSTGQAAVNGGGFAKYLVFASISRTL